ncbi:MAG TPA: ferritin-like domain-containing protein [Acidisphaera sp.]|nr:ferritin-like domain-containing protein [Acidisphaera sp.]
MSGATDTAREIYMTGLRNQHAIENEAVSLLNRQIERTETYPELVERMRLHVQESEGQLRRLEELLHAFGTSHSGFKDTVASIGANLAALGQSMAPDEIIKNSLANFAFENDEIASYKALLVLADASGHRAAEAALQQSLREEQDMAQFIDSHLKDTTLKFLARKSAGMTAGV